MEIKNYCNSSPELKKYDVVIVGAGPAGIMGALQCKEKNMNVLIVEQKSKPAMKLRISGKGRCNITNSAEKDEFMSKFGKNGKFLRQAFNQFFNTELLEFFNKRGVKFLLERGGRYFPESGDSDIIVDTLLNGIVNSRIEIVTGIKVNKISITDSDRFIISLNKIKSKNPIEFNIESEKVLLATGGKSYPATGSDGSGYKLAENLGHRIERILPALVPLKVKGDFAELFNGIVIKNCNVSVWKNGKKKEEKFGEIEFKNSHISGPVILSLSGKMVEMLNQGHSVSLLIDLKPALGYEQLEKRIIREIQSKNNRTLGDVLNSLLPKKMVNPFSETAKIDLDTRTDQIKSGVRRRVRNLLKEFRLEIKGSATFKRAIITSGGITLNEIDPNTMESKLINGLYFAGEIIDVDAVTGGYNLQAAFSTGWVAGKNIKKSLIKRGKFDE